MKGIENKKVGLVLSGGGSRGIAHLGAIKALQESGVKFEAIAGSSAGALVGSLIAGGYSPEFVLETLSAINVRKYFSFSMSTLGLFSLDKVATVLAQYLPHNSFEQLKTNLHVCTADINEGKEVFYSSGELIKPVLASCAIPGVFQPVRFNNRTLVDGGIMNNLPLEPLQQTCDFIIGINVTPVDKNLQVSNAKDVMLKSIYLSVSQQTSRKIDGCDLAIEPIKLNRFDALSTKHAKEIFSVGYEAALKSIDAFSRRALSPDDLGTA